MVTFLHQTKHLDLPRDLDRDRDLLEEREWERVDLDSEREDKSL